MSTLAVNAINAASGGTITITGAALTTPALGTPASGNLANCTGLPASAVVNTPAGGISETTVQGALNGLESRKANVSSPTFTGVATSPQFQASGGAPGFSISNQGTGGARAQFQNTGGTFYLGIDDSSGGLAGPYTINYYYTGIYDQVWSIGSAEKMRLKANGELLVGTAASRSGKLVVGGDVSIIGSQLNAEPGSGQNFALVNRNGAGFDIYVDGAARLAARIEANGELLVGTAASRSGKLVVGGDVSIIGSQLNAEPGLGQNFALVNRIGAGFDIYVDGGAKLAARIDANGYILAGETSGSEHRITTAKASEGDSSLFLGDRNGVRIGIWRADNGAYSGAATAITVPKNISTGRSINAAGTINASGADAAEYRKNNGLSIAKGQIVGYKNDGTLTLTWSEATMARVKSTDPHIVGGDTWGTEDKIGKRPDEPTFTPPEYTGRDKPEGPAPEPQAPTFILTEPEHPGANASPVEATTYVLLKREYDVASDDHAKSVAAFEDAHAAWASLHEQHLRDMADWRTDKVEHEARVESERELFDTTIYPEYQRAKAAFEARLEAARQQVDRIAYCGIVPCNVTGATSGHYIVATEGPGDSIVGVSVRRPTEEQWSWVVGRCLRVLPDGRAEIDVMLS